MKIVFVGLSNKINKMPFDITTNSGKIVHEIISRLKDDCYLMNLVDYAPLDENLRLRYPTEQEIIDCTQKFKKKIKKINPDLIVSFGNITTNHLKKLNLTITAHGKTAGEILAVIEDVKDQMDTFSSKKCDYLITILNDDTVYALIERASGSSECNVISKI